MSATVWARTLLCLVACAGLSACGHGRTPRTAARPLETPAGPNDLLGPAALVIDGHAVYVLDVPSQAIRRLDLGTGRLTTITPSEPLRNPTDMAVAPDHALVVGEVNRVVRLDPATGGVTVLAASAALQRARLGGGVLTGVATDAGGGIHLAGFDRVGRLDPDGTVSHVSPPLGTIGDLRADADGTLFVSVAGPFASQQRILRVGAGGGPVTTVVGPGTPVRGPDGTPQPRVAGPYNLAWDRDGRLLFSDRTRILRWDAASGTVHVVSERHPAEAVWAGLVVASDGSLIVSDHFANRVRRIDARSGRVTVLAGRDIPPPVVTMPMHLSIYPYPVDETCSNDPGDAVLELRAQGARATAVPDAVVRLSAPDGAATRDAAGQEIRVVTDHTGVARMRLAASGDYAFTVFRQGYLPASGAVRLSTSCTARVPVPLTAAPPP